MFARATSLRTAGKAPAAPRASVATTRPVKMYSGKDDVAGLKDAAMNAAQKAAAAAGSALKNVDTDKIKGAMADGLDAIKNVDVDKIKGAAAGGVASVRASIDTALALWGKFDADGDGKLSMEEALDLLNSKEFSAAVEKATGMPHTKRSEADIKTWFNRADFDKSDTLSKREFAVMYAGLQADKAKGGISGMARSVCTALDTDGDGTIGAPELKAILANTPLASLAKMMPDTATVNYRDFLGKAK